MKNVQLGYGRLYNVKGVSLIGGDDVSLRFHVQSVEVHVRIGSNLRLPR